MELKTQCLRLISGIPIEIGEICLEIKNMFKSMLRSILFVISMLFVIQANSQVVVNSAWENNPPFNNCSNSFIQIDGQLMCANYTFVANSVNVVGFNITVGVEYFDSGICLPAIQPFTQVVDLGVLPAGTYSITINGVLNGSATSSIPMSSTVIPCCGAIPSVYIE